jgi:O-antigen/teichoic acid export membrane protein
MTPWFSKTQADAAIFSKVIAILGLSMAMSFPVRAYGGLLDAQLRFDIQSALGILGVALRTGLSIWAILRGDGLLALAWIALIANLPVIVLQIYFARREAPWARIERSKIDRTMIKSFFSYSIYTFISFLADILRFQVDALVIAGMIGLAAVTHYRVASVFASYYTSIICCITGMLQPVLSRLYGAKDQQNLDKVFFFATKVSLSSSLFIAGGLVCWGSPFIARWMGPTYQNAYWPLVVLSIAVLLDVGQNPSISLLYATFRHRFYTYMNSAEGLLNLGISLALARPLGILGVSIGTLVAAFIIRVLVQPYAVCKVCNLDYGSYMKRLSISLLRCLALLGFAIVIAIWGMRPNYLWLFTSASFATVIYAFGVWHFVFNSVERGQLRSLIGARGSSPSELSQTEVTIS